MIFFSLLVHNMNNFISNINQLGKLNSLKIPKSSFQIDVANAEKDDPLINNSDHTHNTHLGTEQ